MLIHFCYKIEMFCEIINGTVVHVHDVYLHIYFMNVILLFPGVGLGQWTDGGGSQGLPDRPTVHAAFSWGRHQVRLHTNLYFKLANVVKPNT